MFQKAGALPGCTIAILKKNLAKLINAEELAELRKTKQGYSFVGNALYL